MKTVWNLVLALLLLCVVALAACGAPALTTSTPGPKPIKAKLTTAYPEGMSSELAVRKLAELAKDKTGGRLIIDVHSGGELYSREDEIMALSTGAIQMVATNAPALVPVHAGTVALLIPYLWKDYQALTAFEQTPEWKASWDKNVEKKLGIKALCRIPVGPGVTANKIRPINRWEDLIGLKMRASSIIDGAMFQSFGVEAVQIPITELWTAMEQGMVDGFASTYAKFAVGPEADYGKFAMKNPAMIIDGWLLVNSEWWDSLPEDIRQVMVTEVLPEVETYAITEMDKVVDSCIESTTKRGVTWTTMQNVDELRKKLGPFYDFIKQMVGDNTLYNKAMEIGTK